MTEKQMQCFFGEYLRKYPPQASEVYELKISKHTALPFDSVQDHQILALTNAETQSLYHKLSDPPVFSGMQTRFNQKRPFDCFCLVKVKAYVVIWFYKPRKPKRFIKIGIANFLKLKKEATRKSITEEMALEVAEQIININ